MKLKILPPEELKRKAVAKLEQWKRAKRIAEKRGRIPESADAAFVVRNRVKRADLSEDEKERLDSELNNASHDFEDWVARNSKMVNLLEKGADVNVKNVNGWTPLMAEAMAGPFGNMMEALIAFGAELDLQNNEGNTALHIAARDNNTAAAGLLIRAGADPHIKNKEGKDVMDVCVWVSDSVAHILNEKRGIPLPAGFDDPDVDEEPSGGGGFFPGHFDDDSPIG